MNPDEVDQYINDLLVGMVSCRQYDSDFNNPERHRTILEGHGEILERQGYPSVDLSSSGGKE